MIRRAAGAAVLVALVTLAGCGIGGDDGPGRAAGQDAGASGGPGASASGAPTGPAVTRLGVRVTGGYGERPRMDVVGTQAPTKVRVEELAPGTGEPVRAGDLLVAGYHVQSWGDERTPSAVLDDSWDRRLPALTVVGSGTTAWDAALAGRKLGSRLLVLVPGAAGWRIGDAPDAGPRAVVVDLLDVVAPGGATGTPVAGTGKGFPVVGGAPGRKPSVSKLDAVVAPSAPASRLLVTGRGAAVAATGSLVVQLLQVDVATGRTVNSTWGRTPKLMPAASVLSRVTALRGARLGSRAVAVLPGSGDSGPQVLVVDVLAQV